jgi:hypothetical protein
LLSPPGLAFWMTSFVTHCSHISQRISGGLLTSGIVFPCFQILLLPSWSQPPAPQDVVQSSWGSASIPCAGTTRSTGTSILQNFFLLSFSSTSRLLPDCGILFHCTHTTVIPSLEQPGGTPSCTLDQRVRQFLLRVLRCIIPLFWFAFHRFPLSSSFSQFLVRSPSCGAPPPSWRPAGSRPLGIIFPGHLRFLFRFVAASSTTPLALLSPASTAAVASAAASALAAASSSAAVRLPVPLPGSVRVTSPPSGAGLRLWMLLGAYRLAFAVLLLLSVVRC